MTRTFLITLDLEPQVIANGELPMIAVAIREDLLSSGHPVVEVKPWSPHDTAQPATLDTTVSESPRTAY